MEVVVERDLDGGAAAPAPPASGGAAAGPPDNPPRQGASAPWTPSPTAFPGEAPGGACPSAPRAGIARRAPASCPATSHLRIDAARQLRAFACALFAPFRVVRDPNVPLPGSGRAAGTATPRPRRRACSDGFSAQAAAGFGGSKGAAAPLAGAWGQAPPQRRPLRRRYRHGAAPRTHRVADTTRQWWRPRSATAPYPSVLSPMTLKPAST